MAIDSPLYRIPATTPITPAEFTAATTGAGVHDASYYGRLKATGEDALDLLNVFPPTRWTSSCQATGPPRY